ncbi:unnamed protein product (macronuclear) [Paramecium tetraurelia]|uniref:Uncharacterized protein n=1 Tax=Paramecium tetraurelia TaxID=5888 RepID=A0C085_PARTE|nr:uncharacterized protein GSPATT00006055001 [Paramecium tetraurelia]CAK64202.1 unnamed protein product [Paramecium tetraurelia]|eukprot:XP_001431600.1 hypothetical protein (macronuclear) [Paramecium tetraurelia strain d4-2]
MSNLSIRKIEHLVEKYIIVQSSIEDLLDNCGMLILDHNIKRLLPLVAYNESNTLIQELMKSFFRKLPLQDDISEDLEPANTIKDNLQSAIKVEILPEPQQQFITSVTKFRKASQKSSMKSSVTSFRKSSLNKQERQQTQQGSLHITFSPIPLQMDQEEDDEDRFYRGVYEMKKKQQEQIRYNKHVSEQQKVQIQQQLLDLKRKCKNGVFTFDNDGSIILTKQKAASNELKVHPETKIHALNLKNQGQKLNLQTQVTNIVNSSIQRKQRLAKIINNVKSDIRMETEPVRVSTSFKTLNNQDLKSKSILKQLLNDQSLKLTKKEFSQLVGLESNIGDVLQQKLLRMTQIQLQRAQYIQQQHSRSITPLIQEEHKEIDKPFIQQNPHQGKIKLNDIRLADSMSNDTPEIYFRNISESQETKKNQTIKLLKQDLPFLQMNYKQSKYAILKEKKHQKINQSVKLRSYTTHE